MSEQIKSLIKALNVLEFLGKFPNGTSLNHISETLKMTKSSVHRVLSTYESEGYVTQLSSGGDYRLTMKLLHVGQSALNSDVTGYVKPHLTNLLASVNETVNFLAFDGDNIIFKDKLEPKDASFRTRTYVGLHSPAYCSAAGKCFLAFANDQVREAYWQRNANTMEQLTENTILEKEAFFQSLDQIRERGFAIDDEENEAGISCVAKPVFNKEKMPIYAISISSLTPKMNRLGFENLAKRLAITALEIEDTLF